MPSARAAKIDRMICPSSDWGKRAWQPTSFILLLDCSLACREGPGLAYFRTIGIGVLGQFRQLAEVGCRLLRLSCSLRSLCRTVQATQPVRRRPKRSLVFI